MRNANSVDGGIKNKSDPKWIDFWDKENIAEWSKETDYCFSKIVAEIVLKPTDTILDVGCGNGYFASHFLPFVSHVFAADTSKKAVSSAAKAYNNENISFLQIPLDQYSDLSAFLPETVKVDYIFMVSVLQYYDTARQVEQMIASAKKIANPRAKLIIVDLLVDYCLLKDVAAALVGALAHGVFLMTLKSYFRYLNNSYLQSRKQKPLLKFASKSEFEDLCQRCGATVTWTKRNYNTNLVRKTAIIAFN